MRGYTLGYTSGCGRGREATLGVWEEGRLPGCICPVYHGRYTPLGICPGMSPWVHLPPYHATDVMYEDGISAGEQRSGLRLGISHG